MERPREGSTSNEILNVLTLASRPLLYAITGAIREIYSRSSWAVNYEARKKVQMTQAQQRAFRRLGQVNIEATPIGN